MSQAAIVFESLLDLQPRLQLALRFAAQNVRADARRVLLAMLGVAIGIAAVASMLLIGHSVTAQATRAFDRLGAEVVTVDLTSSNRPVTTPAQPSETEDNTRITETAATIIQLMPEVHAVTRVARNMNCSFLPESVWDGPEILAAEPSLVEVLSLTVQAGRFLHPLDGRQPWIVLGADARDSLRRVHPNLRLGSALDLCGSTFYVAGILAPYFGDELLAEFKINRSLLISYPAATRLVNPVPPSQLLVRMRPSAATADMVEPLTTRLRTILAKPVQATGARQVSKLRQEQVSLYTRFLAVLGGVALLVGSLGITNVMLVSVSERKAEIGLRMALGASMADVVLQFLVESVLICLCGALLGLLLGTLGAGVALSVAKIDLAINPATALSAALLAVVCGLVAGAYPALRAARLDPVSTLQGQI